MNAVFSTSSKQLVYAAFMALLPLCETSAAPTPGDAIAYFISPKDGDVVPPRFLVKAGVKHRNEAALGVKTPDFRHYHILINLDDLVDFSAPLSENANIRHLDAGASDIFLSLPKGKHTLQILMGDDKHIPHAPPILSQAITITVR
ncbi:DUF4399 domain-containing protein [Enterovibrio baiacu]|uniref:DUF4399 domain-containing protein n=1 Tax=Enterovibrio baiacu TaxID=2491023 RepID=UPI003D09692D